MPADRSPRAIIPTHAGGIVVGFGSRFWHERPMLDEGERVAALTGCYGYESSGRAKRDPTRRVSGETTSGWPHTLHIEPWTPELECLCAVPRAERTRRLRWTHPSC